MIKILRQLSKKEIEEFCNRYGVNEVAVEKFLIDIGGASLETAYVNLRCGRKLHRWNLRTIGAISDGIILATTMNHL